MPEDYEVEPGDCMSSIAFTRGFFWETLWNLPQNASLKTRRKDPNVLMTGDIVHVPDLTVKQESRPVDQTHKFQLKGIPEMLRLQILDADKNPRANLDYTIVIEGISQRGQTDGNGEIKIAIPPNAKTGKLTYAALPDASGEEKTQVNTLQLGVLDPITEVSGLKARLANLGFYKGALNGVLDDATKAAVSAFQKKQGLPETGASDDATQAKLQKLHGH